ncbi:MAG: UDP-N-acetylglucosamine 2-epimerase [Prevotella sp.]|nr:UDP-N-acetylglucosamine 2-epimerase [Prevotella sp.]MCM1075444.1 UDP-N-acetylglucosamine 2-epimerase [Ruminococcus sp.]
MRIAIATTTRADWGLLSPLAAELRSRGGQVYIIASGMHYMEAMGSTYKEIGADGFEIAAAVRTPEEPAAEAAGCIIGFSEALKRIKPDCLICLGDRFEMLAIALAASMERIPIVHIAGGAVSEGAFDDCFRHAITKLASLHLCETPEYRRRVISMGEEPKRVIHTGAIGVYNILNINPIPCEELEESIGFKFEPPTVLCTMHAATLDSRPATEQLAELLSALAEMPDLRVLFTHPNNDVNPAPLIGMLNEFAASNPMNYKVIPSLGRVRYISALHNVQGVIGNSSGGIVEVPSMHIPTLDIGIRQRGRTRAASVIHAEGDEASILEGLQTILSPECQQLAKHATNPYHLADTPKIMADAIMSADFRTILPKKFYEQK